MDFAREWWLMTSVPSAKSRGFVSAPSAASPAPPPASDSVQPIFEPKPHADEQPEKILEVKDSEIKVEKYHSPEDLAKQEAARLEDARRRAEQEDDSVERGLKIMMDGKLERDENVVQVCVGQEGLCVGVGVWGWVLLPEPPAPQTGP